MKFKVGDKIEHKRYGKGRILKIYNENSILVEFENEEACFHDGDGLGQDRHCYWVYGCDLNQAITKPTKEELLKMPIGTIIKTNEEEHNIFVKVGKNDFFNDIYERILDIVEIQKPTHETIYKADEEVKEMTIEEIEKELGYPIKVIKEKED